ncbi:MAG: ABC transporter ATP-binding protein [Clostridia bacterium]|nr:ABC transporter ATP-binding protein [Clostridia bacterium]
MIVLETENVIKQFRQYDTVITAVNRVSMRVEEGEFVAITGESGSGKSTLINLCAGLDMPNSGKIRVLSRDIVAMDKDEMCRFRGKHIGFVFQSHKLVPYLTALENIMLPISASGEELFKYEERLSLLIDRLALGDRLHHLPGELSGGQQQRVAIARALIHYPMLLLADEPTGNLDRANADNVLDLLLGLRRELRQTLVIVTHDDRIAAQADRVYHMDNGNLSIRHHLA